jgi:hypothetical protein
MVAVPWLPGTVVIGAGQSLVVFVRVKAPGEHELAGVVHAGHGVGLDLRLGQGRQEHGGQDGDDGDDDKQFNEREGWAPSGSGNEGIGSFHKQVPVKVRPVVPSCGHDSACAKRKARECI